MTRQVSNCAPKMLSEQVITMALHCPKQDCKQAVISRNDLLDHMYNEHSIKEYRCFWNDCGVSFDDRHSLTKHVLEDHGDGQLWPCPKCPKVLRSHIRVQQHVYYYHTDGLFRCGHPGCGFGPRSLRQDVHAHFRIEHRPRRIYDQFDEATEFEAESNSPCVICMKPMTAISKNRRLPNCSHVLHLRCLLQLIRKNKLERNPQSCPLCRALI